MDGFRFDHLTRLVGARLNRRTSLALLTAGAIGHGASSGTFGKNKKSKKISICYKSQTRKVKKQDWKKKYKGATKGACPADVCASCPDACFATAQAPNTPPPGYGCCPAEKICQGANGLPDQCCDADEYCLQSLAFHVDGGSTVCCRPCAGNTTTGCCTPGFFCNTANQCQEIGTARLPRTRRP